MTNPQEIKRRTWGKATQKYKETHLDQIKQKQAIYMTKLKTDVLSHYSNGKPRCACCGEENAAFLTLDHINGGGNQHRRNLGVRTGTQTYLWIKRNAYPIGFQVFCFNCNFGKITNHNICPHLSEVSSEKVMVSRKQLEDKIKLMEKEWAEHLRKEGGRCYCLSSNVSCLPERANELKELLAGFVGVESENKKKETKHK